MVNLKVASLAGGLVFLPSLLLAQTSQCITDFRNLNLQSDFETASLICPKWNVMSRVDFAYLLASLGVISADDLLESPTPGMVIFREPCSSEIQDAEIRSFKKAEEMGLEAFCIQTSSWLTVPAVRQALESSGAFPTGRE